MRRLLGLGLALLALGALLALRALAPRSMQPAVEPAPAYEIRDADAAVERFAAAIRIPTVSHQDPAQDDRNAFLALHRHLERSFPAMHAVLRRELVNDLGLVYTWPGRDAAKPPVVLMAHQDVVPVEPGTESNWEQPPFSGAVAGGFVWGRGALDTKGKLLALCEAIDRLAAEGFQPERTIYLVSGQDEEVGGQRGGKAIAKRFEARGARFDWVLDEGGVIGEGLLPGVARPVALIGIAEKGYLTLALSVSAEGGHSSIPPPHTAIGILAAAIERLEAQPLPASLGPATRQLLAAIGPEMALPLRIAVGNADLLEPLLLHTLSATPRGNAAVRTTTAVTMLRAGVKENALPGTARAVVNFRILPGDTIAKVTEFVRRVIDDARVDVRPLEGSSADEPSPESRTDSPAFALLARTIRASYPDVVIAPNLVLGGTDARYFRPLSDNVYRFGPDRYAPDDLKRPHGSNERASVRDYLASIGFYVRLIRATD